MTGLQRAVELDAEIDAQQNLRLTGPVPIAGPRHVRVIILFDDGAGVDEEEWLYAAAHNPAFAFLAEEGEDLYTLADGEPYHDAG